MRLCSGNRRTCVAASILVLILLLALAPDSRAVESLRVRVGDTTGAPGQQNSVVTVFLTNTFDDIAAFTIHLILTRNDIANFQTSVETVVDSTYWDCLEWNGSICLDSVAVDFPDINPWDFMHVTSVEAFTGNFDTVGTLISGWEQVESRAVSTGDLGLDIKVTAIADKSTVSGYKPPIHPQQGGILFKLRADIFPIPDTQTDREVGIMVDVAWKPYFVFSTPEGVALGWITVQVPDTNYYMCTNWDPTNTICLSWDKVHKWECPGGVCDSVWVGTVDVAELDTTKARVINGKISVTNWICGDCNGLGSGNSTITISDVSLLVDHLFINKTPIIPVERCNTNCSTEVPVVLTIGDVSTLIDHLFVRQLPLCGCHQ